MKLKGIMAAGAFVPTLTNPTHEADLLNVKPLEHKCQYKMNRFEEETNTYVFGCRVTFCRKEWVIDVMKPYTKRIRHDIPIPQNIPKYTGGDANV